MQALLSPGSGYNMAKLLGLLSDSSRASLNNIVVSNSNFFQPSNTPFILVSNFDHFTSTLALNNVNLTIISDPTALLQERVIVSRYSSYVLIYPYSVRFYILWHI